MKILHLIFSAIASIATLSLAALAFYGAFFTNLPEVIITQLRLEVTETREQVIDLTRERRNLISEIDEARRELFDVKDDLAVREREFQLAVDDLNRKKIEIDEQEERLNKIKESILKIKEAKEVYLNNASEVVFSNFSTKINDKLLSNLDDAKKLRDIQSMKDWIRRQELLKNEIRVEKENKNFEKMFKLIEENIDSVPKSWRKSLLVGFFRESTPAERELDHADILNSFISKMLKDSRKKIVTGKDLFKEAIFETDMSILLLEDRNRFLLNFEREIDSSAVVLSKPVKVVIFDGWSDDRIKENSEIIINNINLTIKKVNEFRKKLLLLRSD